MEVGPTDSGYPTPRDDIPSSSRAESPSQQQKSIQLTSTPIRTKSQPRRSLKNHFASFREDLSLVEASNKSLPVSENSSVLIEVIKPLLHLTREIKLLKKENESLREESSRIFNLSDIQSKPSQIPKLIFPPEMKDDYNLKNEIKEEVSSFLVTDSEKMEKQNVITATATIQVEQEKTDIDVQTDTIEDTERVINTTLQVEVENLTVKLENTEKEKISLKNRLFDYEKLKVKFEENEEKLKRDIETLNSRKNRSEKRIEDLESRLSVLRKENDEIRDENKVLLESSKLHDFEIDEFKIQVDSSRNEVLAKNTEVLKLNEDLEEERKKKLELMKSKERMEEDYKLKIKELSQNIENILAKELSENAKVDMILKESNELKEKNEILQKENAYLEDAKRELIDKEMSIKRDLAELAASLRLSESRLNDSEKKLDNERELRNNSQKWAQELEEKLSEFERDKMDTDELLLQLKKAKEEIDFLRNEVSSKRDYSEEIQVLRKELMEKNDEIENLNEQLEKKEEREIELSKKLDDLMRENSTNKNDLENWKPLKESLESKIGELTSSNKELEVNISEIAEKYKLLEEDYQLYMKNAFAEFHSTVAEKDEEISHLRARLVELETYPGQTISTSKRNQLTQTETEEISEAPSSRNDCDSPNGSRSSVGSLISNLSNRSTIDSRILKINEKLKECMKRDLDSSYCYRMCSEIGNQVIEIIETLNMDSQAPVASAGRFWDSIKRIIRKIENEWKEKLEKCVTEKNEIGRDFEKLEERIKSLKIDLQDAEDKIVKETSENVRLLQENTDMEDEIKGLKGDIEEMKEKICGLEEAAVWFREEYERYYKGVEERNEEIEKLQMERNAKEEERFLMEEECKSLRERLDSVLHEVQVIRRANIKTDSTHDEDIDKLKKALDDANEEILRIRRNFDISEEMNRKNIEKRKYADETTRLMKDAYEKNEKRVCYLRMRNTQRQKLIVHMIDGVEKAIGDNKNSYTILEKVKNKAHESGLLENDTEDEISLTGTNGSFRRVLKKLNNGSNGN